MQRFYKLTPTWPLPERSDMSWMPSPAFPIASRFATWLLASMPSCSNYEHQPADTPYRSRYAIFVREGACRALDMVDAITEVTRIRPISLRAFSEGDEMVDADLAEGEALVPLIECFFGNPDVAYLQAHYAKRGCYAARIVRT